MIEIRSRVDYNRGGDKMDISNELVLWYKENQRLLPFRESRDPYFIWVSEIMAQQTRIDTMIPYYLRWIEKWPTVASLAQAKIEEVLKMWEGLGYYNRARSLHAGAIQVMERFEGQLPANIEQLQSISGIGFYTAGAIGSIAFGLQSPAVDGNVLRVVSRMLEIKQDVSKKKTMDEIYQIIKIWMSGVNSSDFTQGLMELGATVCTPNNALCGECPLKADCQAYAHDCVYEYPVKKQAKAPVILVVDTYLIENEAKQWLLSRDCTDGLMQGMMRLPQYPVCSKVIFDNLKTAGKRKHVFSHRVWDMHCWQGSLSSKQVCPKDCFWCNEEELNNYSIVTAHKKWLEEKILERRK